MKTLVLALTLIMAAGCSGVNFAVRSVVINTTQDAEKGGTIYNHPSSRDASVAAEKTTDVKADVPITK